MSWVSHRPPPIKMPPLCACAPRAEEKGLWAVSPGSTPFQAAPVGPSSSRPPAPQRRLSGRQAGSAHASRGLQGHPANVPALHTCRVECAGGAVVAGAFEDCCLGYNSRFPFALLRRAKAYRIQEVSGGCNLPAVM